MRELAAIILVCSKAIEGVVDVLAGQRHTSGYGHGGYLYDDAEYV